MNQKFRNHIEEINSLETTLHIGIKFMVHIGQIKSLRTHWVKVKDYLHRSSFLLQKTMVLENLKAVSVFFAFHLWR